MNGDRPAVLVVEDEADIRELIALRLRRDGYRVDEAANGEEALTRLRTPEGGRYSLLVFDWMLPGMSGIDLIRAVRGVSGASATPILMVTARIEPADIVAGLEAGADDYVTKPFEIPVLLARVRALLRRASLPPGGAAAAATAPEKREHELYALGSLRVDAASHQVSCSDQEVKLTPSEFKLLLALVQNQGRVLTRQRLIDLVQGEGVSVVDRAIDTHVFGLRKKLGGCGELIETVRGVGYRVRTE